jgi:signal transduction histidine kinase
VAVSWLVNVVSLPDRRREALGRAARGLMEVLVGADPPPALASSAERIGIGVLSGVGAALVLWAGVETVFMAFGQAVLPGPFYQGLFAGLGALLVSARFPLLGWRIAYLFILVVPRLPGQPPISPLDATQFFLLLLVFALAGWRHSRAALWWMWALMLVPVWLWVGPGLFPGLFGVFQQAVRAQKTTTATGVRAGFGLATWWWSPAIASAAVTALAVAVDTTGAWRRTRRALVVQSERTELEEARRAVLEERTRVARELHDVVAHHMSLIAVQTETARYRLPELQEAAVAEFASVSKQAREALSEMRRLLGVLRDHRPAERAPQPQLGDVPALVAASVGVGMSVSLSMSEDTGRVPTAVGLCAYRVIQEALANASRHAPGSTVSVSLERNDGALCVQVTNGPGRPPASSAVHPQPGHGLLGMRERVALLGGSFESGPAPGGGFALSAVLPLEAPSGLADDPSLASSTL